MRLFAEHILFFVSPTTWIVTKIYTYFSSFGHEIFIKGFYNNESEIEATS